MNIKSFLSGLLVGLIGVAIVFGALEIQTDIKNALIYIQKIFVTSDGTSNGEKRVVIDGSDGSILMSGSLNVKGDVILKEKVIDGYEIADNAVNDRVLADDAVDTAAIQDGSITNEKISNSAITSDKILDETITENDLSENSVGASELKESDYYEMKGLFLSDGDLVLQNPSDGWKTEIRSAGPIYIHPDDDKTGDDNFYITNSEGNPWIVFSQSEKVGIGKTNPEAKVDINGNTIIRGNLDMKNNSIINLADPVNDTDAVNKRYVDNKVKNVSLYRISDYIVKNKLSWILNQLKSKDNKFDEYYFLALYIGSNDDILSKELYRYSFTISNETTTTTIKFSPPNVYSLDKLPFYQRRKDILLFFHYKGNGDKYCHTREVNAAKAAVEKLPFITYYDGFDTSTFKYGRSRNYWESIYGGGRRTSGDVGCVIVVRWNSNNILFGEKVF